MKINLTIITCLLTDNNSRFHEWENSELSFIINIILIFIPMLQGKQVVSEFTSLLMFKMKQDELRQQGKGKNIVSTISFYQKVLIFQSCFSSFKILLQNSFSFTILFSSLQLAYHCQKSQNNELNWGTLIMVKTASFILILNYYIRNRKRKWNVSLFRQVQHFYNSRTEQENCLQRQIENYIQFDRCSS